MTKDEIKNKISMALKDPTLQQGFEIICKENAELDKKLYRVAKERRRLRKRNEEFKIQLYAFDEEREKLRKENAELKGLKDVATLIRANNDTVTTLMQLNNMLVSKNQQLTKAKEIIKELNEGLDKLYLSGLSNKQIAFIEQLQDKAEQFLSEVEKGQKQNEQNL